MPISVIDGILEPPTWEDRIHIKKRIVFLLLCLALLLLLPAFAAADESGTCGDNLTWSFNSSTGKLTITGSGDMADYYNDQPWAPVMGQITSISLPNGLTSIGSCAFEGSERLVSISILNSVTNISEYAFCGCTGLTSVTIPDSVIYLEEDVLMVAAN